MARAKYLPALKGMKGCGRIASVPLHLLRWKHGKRRQELEVEELQFYPHCGDYYPGRRRHLESFTRVRKLLCEECLVKYGIKW